MFPLKSLIDSLFKFLFKVDYKIINDNEIFYIPSGVEVTFNNLIVKGKFIVAGKCIIFKELDVIGEVDVIGELDVMK